MHYYFNMNDIQLGCCTISFTDPDRRRVLLGTCLVGLFLKGNTEGYSWSMAWADLCFICLDNK